MKCVRSPTNAASGLNGPTGLSLSSGLHVGRFIDLSDKKFGRLRVMGRSETRYEYWVCHCSCPARTIKEVRGGNLRSGQVRSCGCLQREAASAVRSVDLCGETFGQLKVIRKLSRRSRVGQVVWLCRCECTREIRVNTSSLRSGNTKSCGCKKLRLTSFQGKKLTPSELALIGGMTVDMVRRRLHHGMDPDCKEFWEVTRRHMGSDSTRFRRGDTQRPSKPRRKK